MNGNVAREKLINFNTGIYTSRASGHWLRDRRSCCSVPKPAAVAQPGATPRRRHLGPRS